jgi:hypothetical protein
MDPPFTAAAGPTLTNFSLYPTVLEIFTKLVNSVAD